MSKFNLNHVPWNKGKKIGKGHRWTEEQKIMLSQIRKNRIAEGKIIYNKPMLGKKHSLETKKKIGLSREYPKGESHPRYGIKNSIELREKISRLNKEHPPKTCFKPLENHPSWKGGKSFEFYGVGFNKTLKEQIRQRDNYRCQECFRHQSELKHKLNIHHVDFNKNNNHPNNLISLCNSCHSQTNFNREEWIDYFKERINGRL